MCEARYAVSHCVCNSVRVLASFSVCVNISCVYVSICVFACSGSPRVQVCVHLHLHASLGMCVRVCACVCICLHPFAQAFSSACGAQRDLGAARSLHLHGHTNVLCSQVYTCANVIVCVLGLVTSP